MDVSPSYEENSWWKSVGQVESVEKIMKNLKTGKVTHILRNENTFLFSLFFFIIILVTPPVFMFFLMIFQLIPPVLRTPTNYGVHY